jgi:hypothetical protein
MPAAQRPVAASTWVIHSVAVRTRDGPDRLDQAYRRLIDDTAREQRCSTSGLQPGRTDADPAPEPRR